MYSSNIVKFRVREPFLAVRNEPEHRFAFTTIPEGAIIATRGTPQESGLIEIDYDRQKLEAFLRDIEDRCEQVQAMPE